MSTHPRTIEPQQLAVDCIELMEQAPKVLQLLVVDARFRLIGAVHVHDLFRAKVI